jgi:ATP-binding cassette, subfamily B, bacterial MsbA
MKTGSIAELGWRYGRKIFYRGTRKLTWNEKEGLRRAIRNIISHRLLLVATLLSGFAAALFEGGSLGLFGLAISVVTGESNEMLSRIPHWASDTLHSWQESLGIRGVFLLLVGIAVAAQMLKSVLTFVSTATHIALAYKTLGTAQRDATHQVMSMTFCRLTQYPAGKLAMLVDEAGIASSLANEFGKSSRAILMLVVYIVMMFVLSWKLSIAAIAIFGAAWLGLTWLSVALKKLSKKSVEGDLENWKWAVEFFSSPRLLHIFDITEYASRLIDQARSKRIGADQKRGILIATIVPAFELLTVSAAGVFLVFGYYSTTGSNTGILATTFVFILIFYRAKPQVKLINDLRVVLSDLIPRFEVIGKLFDPLNTQRKTTETRSAPASFNDKIRFRNVFFTYPGADRPVLNGLNLSISKGESIALTGESGSGKSTIIDLLLGLYQPDAGQITIDGKPMQTVSITDWRAMCGVVDQEVVLLNTTVYENIQFGRDRYSKKDVEAVAKLSLADGFIRELEGGYETIIGDRGYKLSGGQQQRLTLARALLHNPAILILDEATSALDVESEEKIKKAIDRVRGTRTIITVAHRQSTIEFCDRVFVLNNGQVTEKAHILSQVQSSMGQK